MFKNTHKRALGTLTFFAVGLLGATESHAQDHLYIEFRQRWVLGHDDREDALLFGAPQSLQVDPDGRLIIADHPRKDITVLESPLAEAVYRGSRGRGPGEIQEVSAIALSGEGEIVVVDRMNARVTLFEMDGSSHVSFPLPIPWISPSWVLPLSTGGYVMYYGLSSGSHVERHDREFLLHLYSDDFSGPLDSFADRNDIWDLSTPLGQNMAAVPRGMKAAIDAQDRIYLAPATYEGTVYRYVRDPETGRTTMTRLRGVLRKGGAFEHVEIDTRGLGFGAPELRGVQLTSGPGGTTKIRRYSSSRGIACLSDGRILHFSMRYDTNSADSDTRVFVEVFSADGQLSGFGPVQNIPAFTVQDSSVLHLLATHDDTVYIADERPGYPVVRAGTIYIADR